jgi:Methyltransferase domain
MSSTTALLQLNQFSALQISVRGLIILALSALALIRLVEFRALSTLIDYRIDQDVHYNLNHTSEPMIIANATGFELAYVESLGFFTDIPNNLWLSRKAISKERVHNSVGKKNPWNPIGTYFQMNWDPDFACFLEDSIGGKVGDGHKWICDPIRLASQPDCLVYSIGSNAQFDFELHLSQIAPNCEIHIFDPDDYSKNLARTSIRNATYHAWGLKATDKTKSDHHHVKANSLQLKQRRNFLHSAKYLTLPESIDILGHQGRRIDIIKIDCEGCEWELHNDLLQQDLRQIVIEVHWLNKNTHQFFTDLTNQGYVIFHKESNIQWAFGKCIEFSFLKLSKQFFQ